MTLNPTQRDCSPNPGCRMGGPHALMRWAVVFRVEGLGFRVEGLGFRGIIWLL